MVVLPTHFYMNAFHIIPTDHLPGFMNFVSVLSRLYNAHLKCGGGFDPAIHGSPFRCKAYADIIQSRPNDLKKQTLILWGIRV